MALTRNGPHYGGALYEATREGFVKLLAEANEAVRIGYDLVAVERVGNQLGAVFRKQVARQEDAANLVGE
jgi:hypothetical protein